ncbi:MAG: hypothetical protein JOZ91_05850 [Candidatus Eremiobacteraeota bacterium]|nr:hypothetical protein [Candidatus Eremiobacteraeota bacterium]MBV8204026.1 hypothetical protein [Candidatus Eremiobacteraeota bacterium]MBV8339435.1 hypothetical protein [Candidatus Eremiobacteraeota bacterium]MBV8669721.1 hypothetical protein [Candidatus Eremiobacteraeota bacterium]
MSPELLTALASVGTFVVIAASAIAALVQLRHLRRSNQLSGLLSVLELFQQTHFHELINFVRSELPQRMEDPAFRAGLEHVPVDRRKHPELHVADMYEEIGSYVRCGLIDEDQFLLGHWLNVLLYWSLLHPCMVLVRSHSPNTFENFEYLAARALAWRNKHPSGNYPRELPRVDGSIAYKALVGKDRAPLKVPPLHNTESASR